MKLSGIVELLFLYDSFTFHICIPFPVVFIDLEMSKIGCVNYARFPKSSHIFIAQSLFPEEGDENEKLSLISVRSELKYDDNRSTDTRRCH